MTAFFEQTPSPEHSAGLVFSGGTIERRSERRAPDCLEQALADTAGRIIMFAEGRVLVNFSAAAANPLFQMQQIAPFNPRLDAAVLLGFDDGRPLLAIPADINMVDDDAGLPSSIKAIDYRSLAIQGLLSAPQMGQVAQGAALLAWHASHRYCSRCGKESQPADGGYRRHCANCQSEHFPRTDPVVIMLVVDGERCLLGRGHQWPQGVYSALAGFVEPGETIEAAVRREIGEESGIITRRVQYQANQPWPFPHSLMIGCFAEAVSTAITMDEDELQDCRWFTLDEVTLALENSDRAGFSVPPKMAIAYHLIDYWARKMR